MLTLKYFEAVLLLSPGIVILYQTLQSIVYVLPKAQSHSHSL